MLGEGLRAGLDYMGIPLRTCCYVEREAYAAAVLAARCQEGSLDDAPIWSDLLTFDAGAWRGSVDGIVAGFPCQDLSLAGRRAGLDGKRSGLFFNILDIADRCGAWFLFLENVSGIASATASVVDEAEGELEERAAARVVGELAERGWNAEWLTLSASDVGASHGRERWFCFAWRELDDAGCVQRCARHEQDRSAGSEAGGHEAHNRPADRGNVLGHPGLQHQHLQQREDGAESARANRAMAHTQRSSDERRGEPGDMACTRCDPESQARQRQRGGSAADGCGCAVADTSSKRPQAWVSGQIDRQEGDANRPFDGGCARPLFAPGPANPDWAGIIRDFPWLAPALPGDSGANRLNPCFVENLMGWPIFWTHINAKQTDDQKASAARNTAEWRKVLQMWMCDWIDEAPRGLQQAAGCGDSLPFMPLKTPQRGAGDEAAPLPGLRITVHPKENGPVNDLFRPCMPENAGTRIGCKEVGESSDNGQLSVLQSGVSEEAPTANSVQPFLWEQARMGEEAMSNRAQRLKCGGNGVVAACAAAAFVQLARRAGFDA
jgi:DNA (cytosine-5)-methyltransferase 1